MPNAPRILLAEDDRNFGIVLKDFLEINQFDVQLCKDGVEALQVFTSGEFDLCLLDVMMPRKDGFTLAADIRKMDETIPIIFLTASSLKEDMMNGFKIGADDYIIKPFDSELLLLKIKAVLKRALDADKKFEETYLFEIGKYTFNHKLRTLEIDGKSQKLSPKEGELLKLFCFYMNDILPRHKALKTIWGTDNYFTARSMDVYITKIRKFLKEDPNIDIINVHGNGYRMVVGK